MNNIINKIIEQGNKENVDLNIITSIENYMENYMQQKQELNYDLICRFILMEYNAPIGDYQRCIKYLRYLNKKNISNEKYKGYFLVLLAYIEGIWTGITKSTKKKLDNMLLYSNNSYVKSMIYYMKSVELIFSDNYNANKIIELLKSSIEEDNCASKSYLLLSNIYKDLGNVKLAQQFLEQGLEKIKIIQSKEDLEKSDMTNIEYFFDSSIRGTNIYILEYNEICNGNIY